MRDPRRRSRRPIAVVGAVLAALALVAGCSGPADTTDAHRTATLDDPNPVPLDDVGPATLPATVRGADGAEVTVTDTSRIVAIDRAGTLAQTVYALGLGDHLVGRPTVGFPAIDDVPNVMPAGHTLNAESILSLDPTVVLTDTTVGPAEVQRQIRDSGVPVVFVDPAASLDTVGPKIEAVADALGVPEAGDRLARRTADEVAAARATVPASGGGRSVAFLYLRGSAVSMLGGPGSGADSLVDALGEVDAGTASGLTSEFVPITSEALVAAAPDVILVMTDSLASVGGIDGLLSIPGIAQTPAGENRAIVDMADTELLSFGPNTGRVLSALVRAFYPDAP